MPGTRADCGKSPLTSLGSPLLRLTDATANGDPASAWVTVSTASTRRVAVAVAASNWLSSRLVRCWLSTTALVTDSTTSRIVLTTSSPASSRERSDIVNAISSGPDRQGRRAYPTPRCVWIRGGPSGSSFRRR